MTRFEKKGEDDARRGITACEYDQPKHRQLWARGHDRVVDARQGPLPRFGRFARRLAPRPMDLGL